MVSNYLSFVRLRIVSPLLPLLICSIGIRSSSPISIPASLLEASLLAGISLTCTCAPNLFGLGAWEITSHRYNLGVECCSSDLSTPYVGMVVPKVQLAHALALLVVQLVLTEACPGRPSDDGAAQTAKKRYCHAESRQNPKEVEQFCFLLPVPSTSYTHEPCSCEGHTDGACIYRCRCFSRGDSDENQHLQNLLKVHRRPHGWTRTRHKEGHPTGVGQATGLAVKVKTFAGPAEFCQCRGKREITTTQASLFDSRIGIQGDGGGQHKSNGGEKCFRRCRREAQGHHCRVGGIESSLPSPPPVVSSDQLTALSQIAIGRWPEAT